MTSSKTISRLKSLLLAPGNIVRSLAALEQLKFNQGLILERLNRSLTSTNLHEYEFKVFSQLGEDGIIQKLVSAIDIPNKTFIEFGVETFTEANCRFLMAKDNWSGFVIDGSRKNIEILKTLPDYLLYELKAIQAFITRENINDLLAQSGFPEDVGILSIDLDGVDYWVLEKITTFRPRILITEYNAVFGGDRKISVPYAADFQRTKMHHSNLYFGASLPAMVHLANKKGYAFVGTNSTGNNAFFVRHDLMNASLLERTAAQGFTPSKFRESRDQDGKLTYLNGDERLAAIKGLPVVNVETEIAETL